MKTEKMKIAEQARMDSAQKWGDFFESGQPFTAEKKKEMLEDRERVKRLCEEATREWLETLNAKG